MRHNGDRHRGHLIHQGIIIIIITIFLNPERLHVPRVKNNNNNNNNDNIFD